MKNNKLTTKLLSFVAAIALVFTMSSCNQELMETTYTPDNNNVTFSVASAYYSLDGEPLVVTIQRGVAKEAINVNLTLEDAKGVYTLSSNTVSFAAGEYTKQVSLSYELSKLQPIVNYAFTLSFDAKDKAAAGYNKFTASATMPLEYEAAGNVNITGNYIAPGITHKLYIAKYTNNYYMIENVFGSGKNIEFNIVDGKVNLTAPSFTGISGLISQGFNFPSKVDIGLGPVTFWFDCDPNYVLTALDANGLFSKGSIIQFDAIYQMGGKYYGWYKIQIIGL